MTEPHAEKVRAEQLMHKLYSFDKNGQPTLWRTRFKRLRQDYAELRAEVEQLRSAGSACDQAMPCVEHGYYCAARLDGTMEL